MNDVAMLFLALVAGYIGGRFHTELTSASWYIVAEVMAVTCQFCSDALACWNAVCEHSGAFRRGFLEATGQYLERHTDGLPDTEYRTMRIGLTRAEMLAIPWFYIDDAGMYFVRIGHKLESQWLNRYSLAVIRSCGDYPIPLIKTVRKIATVRQHRTPTGGVYSRAKTNSVKYWRISGSYSDSASPVQYWTPYQSWI